MYAEDVTGRIETERITVKSKQTLEFNMVYSLNFLEQQH